MAAAVANLNLAVANVALPTIGRTFDASQTELNLTAVGYNLGMAASVFYLGALGDRQGRKLLLLLAGSALSLPLSFLAAYAPNIEVLIVARIVGGVADGMCYPTTLALIAALWSGPSRTRSIALWSAIGAAFASLGPLLSGILLGSYWWGSVFPVTVPIAVVSFAMAWFCVPAHVNETTKPVDNLGGVFSVLLVGSLILGINFAVAPNAGAILVGLGVVFVVALAAFVIRQRRAANPLYSLAAIVVMVVEERPRPAGRGPAGDGRDCPAVGRPRGSCSSSCTARGARHAKRTKRSRMGSMRKGPVGLGALDRRKPSSARTACPDAARALGQLRAGRS
ncbi:MFS transporter [Streptomyces sp. AB3(2024)]|uniref:MFS transporter n=1 Tax=Streptomyces sp. AB3(2024) TaxID=3317321 RepID=UPI0035A2BECA